MRRAGGKRIALARLVGGIRENVDHVGVDLLERDQLKVGSADRGLQQAAILQDVFALIPSGEAEIEDFCSVERTNASWSGAEPMD